MTKANSDTTKDENLIQSSQALWLRLIANALTVAPNLWLVPKRGNLCPEGEWTGCWWLENNLEKSQGAIPCLLSA